MTIKTTNRKQKRKELILHLTKELKELEELLSLNWFSPDAYRFDLRRGKRK